MMDNHCTDGADFLCNDNNADKTAFLLNFIYLCYSKNGILFFITLLYYYICLI